MPEHTAEQLDKIQRDADLRAVMSTAAGRRFVARILYRVCHVKEISYAVDLGSTKFHDGQRAVAVAVESELERVCPALRDQMEREQVENLRDFITRAAAERVPTEPEGSAL